MRAAGSPVGPERIVLTVSSSDAYSLLFRVLCDPGDQVLAPRPSYPLFEHLGRLDAVTIIPYDLEYHGAWSIDVASVERALSDRTRALLLVTPNNPTGSYVKSHELDRLAAICAARDVAIDRGRGVRRLRARSRRRAVERTRPGAPGRSDVQSGGAFEIHRVAAGEAGLDWRRRPGGRRRATHWRGSSSRATRICRSRRRCSWPHRNCWIAARRCAGRFRRA